MKRLVVSRIQTPDGTILTSKHRHDYVGHHDLNGDYYFLDGGTDYQRRSVNKVPAKNVSLYDDAPFEELRKYITRGTFDENGFRVWKPICELSNAHLDNIITYETERGNQDSIHCNCIKQEIQYRKDHGIVILDNWDGQET